MSGQPTDETRCPICGEPYERRLVVERGQQWGDIYPGSPLSFFTKYRRRCTGRNDVETDTVLSEGECAVYFHDAGKGMSVL